nr:AAA family ATPase [Legionella jordanis]
MLSDSLQRSKATDPSGSFIVQAPAGSGKTELLTQRFLRLLSTVNAPEEIIALTFTRKAASEMRERILHALRRAYEGEKPDSAHQQQTQHYAQEALARSEQLGWDLLKQPGRLSIMTLDALCQMICHAIPLQDRQIPYSKITEKPEAYYHMAVRSCLDHALSDARFHPSLKTLLAHVDNRQDKLLTFFSEMLANRDQWLSSLYMAREQEQTAFENMLAQIEELELNRFKESVYLEDREPLCFLARLMAEVTALPDLPHYPLRNWFNFEDLNREQACGLASILLTSKNEIRSRLDLKRGACDNQLYDQIKTQSTELFKRLKTTANFLECLLKVKSLPAPRYHPEQWQVLQALFNLLPLLVAHLQLIFGTHNEVDFTAISQQALFALGEEDNPTDLALHLDNRINHLLIDEFQDTSISQYQLLEKLVRGWEPQDGRTLFLVGDPMQSIYRFRQAEVGLFLKAKQQGIGSVKLEFLELCCNFRSSATIVNWINKQFSSIFPAKDSIESGAISFHPSVAVLPSPETSWIKAYQFQNRSEEAKALVDCAIQELQDFPQDEVAILVRSRNQLAEVFKILRARQIPFQAVEIELLSKLPHLRDLYTLTEALLMPANRLAWLSFLRSPFCGLSLVDLHAVANFDKKKSIYHALMHLNQIALSEEGRLRLEFIQGVLHNALLKRHQLPLVEWITDTLKELHVDAILPETKRADLQQFWALLERFSENGYPNLEQFRVEFNKLYAKRSHSSRLQVMTIHKSKGLEFDSIILPGLSTKGPNQETPLLRWLKFPSAHNDFFLVSPIKAAHHENCLLYNYLAKLDAEKSNYELQRLLYVAATRAKKRLYLFDYSERESKGSFRKLLKNQEFISTKSLETEEISSFNPPPLQRLPTHYYQNKVTLHHSINAIRLPKFAQNLRPIGVVAHELLQWVCNNHPENIQQLPWDMVSQRFKTLGFNPGELKTACAWLKEKMANLFANPIGQWIIKAQAEEANEYALIISREGEATTRILDRTFIYQGKRWIIDFKTGNDDEQAQDSHRQQVNEYASYFINSMNNQVHCGLFYLASGKWLTWEYQTPETLFMAAT